MAKGALVVASRPSPEHDSDYNAWYDETHIPEILTIPGFVSAKRYRVHGSTPGAEHHTYLAIYQIDAEDVAAPVAELRARSAAGKTTQSGIPMDLPAVVTLYELIS